MRELTYLEAVREAMSQEMRQNEDVFILGEDIGVYGGAFGVTRGMIEEFGPERIRNTPISESGIAGAAVGAALTGMRPILELQFSDFITIAMDQMVNQSCEDSLYVWRKRKSSDGFTYAKRISTGAAAQHSQSLEAWVAHVPGLKVVQPSTAHDVKGLLKAAMDDDNPVIFYEHKLLYKTKGDVPEEQYSIPLGKADIKREGTDVTIVATAIMVHRALEAAEELEKEGISAEVVDPRTLVPLDTETIIQSVSKTSRLVVVHEAVKRGGYGAEIASMIAESEAFDYLDAPIKRLGGASSPIPYNPELEKMHVPQVPDIIQAAKETLNKA